jgi:ABC-2 type transport system permease protein
MLAKVRRGGQIANAFMWIAYQDMIAYPLGFIITRIASFVSVLSVYFVAQLVDPTGTVGGDYFTFAIIGILSVQIMSVGLTAFTTNLDYIIQQGRFESYLVEPVNWRLLPFALGAWPMLVNTTIALLMGGLALLLGADIDVSGLPVAILVLVLGVLAGHAVGILAASVKVIAKRGDPIIGLYTLASGFLSGTAFPVELLPVPLKVIAYCLPPTYVISALRQSLMPDASGLTGPTPLQAVLLLLVFIAIVYPIALWLYGRALEFGRKMGLLAGY